MFEQDVFCLTMPSDGARSTRWVTGRFLKKLARDLFSLPKELYGDDLSLIRAGIFDRLRNLGKEAVLSIVRRPQVHVFLCCSTGALIGRNVPLARARARDLLFQLAFEMSLDGALGDDVVWTPPFPSTMLVSPTHKRSVSWDSDVESIRFAPNEMTSSGGVLSWDDSRYPTLDERFVLALADSNPMSDFEAHPDKEGNQLSLGAAPIERWLQSLNTALSVVADGLPGIYREMTMIHQQFVPVGTDEERHLSASYQESVGTIYLTLHPQQMTMTEAVIHEFQHNKLNMLFQIDSVLENAFHPLFISPVRPDPRPLHGLMLAAHAFVPVAELYRRLVATESPVCRQGGFNERFHRIVDSNSAALEVLVDNGKPTRLGQAVIDEMVQLNEAHRVFVRDQL